MQKFFNVEKLKNEVPAQQVVAKYLGMPKNVTGKAAFWETPFRQGAISGTPLMVTEKYIRDLGGDFSGDIISFVCKLKDVKPYEAVHIIAEDFDAAGIGDYVGENEFRVLTDTKKVEKIVLEKGEPAKEIFTMLDTEAYKKKPTKEEIGKIKNRISSLKISPYKLSTLTKEIPAGHTCIPAGIEKDADKNWKQQQVFMVDIDNTIKVGKRVEKISAGDSRHVTLEKIIDYCDQNDLRPTFIYQTLSYTDDCNKFRLVYVMQEPVTDIEVAKGIYLYLLEKLHPLNIDEAPTQLESLFFGGKVLCECSEIYYKPVKKEVEVQKTRYEIVQDFGEYNEPIKMLENFGLGVRQGYLCKISQGKDGEVATPISNFLPFITKQITYTNGKDEFTNYGVKALLLQSKKELPEITVTKDELESVSYATNPEWNIQAIKEPIRNVEDTIRYVTQLISKDNIECKKVYAHTGFMRVNGKLVYLSNGKVIGDVKDLDVDLSLDRLEQYSFTEKKFDLKDAAKTSYSILDVADHKITIPLQACVFLAPLVSLFAENGMFADFTLWVEGPTGSRKSSLVAVDLSHYGKFTRNSFPCSFRDTVNSLEKKAYVLKDTLTVVDDYAPETVGTGKTGTAERLVGAYGDRVR